MECFLDKGDSNLENVLGTSLHEIRCPLKEHTRWHLRDIQEELIYDTGLEE